ncbi:hypothetical protein [Candidatus Chlorohelix sp.]|uniref:hypothetical protein n=1 Tax=Candidatus Chlorohelix sp. TaxID=3139201 RepID=UPI00306663A5
MGQEEKQSLERRLDILRRRLDILLDKKAAFGTVAMPIYDTLDLQNTQRDIKELEDKLSKFEVTATESTAISDKLPCDKLDRLSRGKLDELEELLCKGVPINAEVARYNRFLLLLSSLKMFGKIKIHCFQDRHTPHPLFEFTCQKYYSLKSPAKEPPLLDQTANINYPIYS